MKKVSAAWLVAGISAMGLPGRSSGGEGPIRFPADAGIVDVTEYGAVPGDEFDDTEAIQAALDTFPNGNRIVYLPPGTYRISDTLRWPGGGESAMQKRTILQGAGEGETLLRLPEATAGFTDAANPKPLIWTGGAPAQRYRNAIRDLAVEIGPGNAGAVGVQLAASGQGGMRRVTIRAAQGSGRIGLDLGHADEIGPLLVKHLVVEGFETGIATKWPLNSNTFEHVHLAGQRRQGWWNYHQMVFVRDLVSENRVPSLYNEKESWGAVTLLGAHLHALRPEPGTPAILNQRQMYLRDVEILGYPKGVDHDDRGREKGDIDGPGTVAEDTSHREVRSLFREVGDGTFAEAGEVVHLPVKEVPEVPWGEPGPGWANLLDFGADGSGTKDSSAALQKAIDSGAETVYLPGGATFRFSGTVEIRGPVRRIVGCEGRVIAEGSPVWKVADGRHPQNLADAPEVVVERMARVGGGYLKIRHESARTLVMSATMGIDVEGAGKGDLFLEDVSGHLGRVAPGQSVWCRQLNCEREGARCINEGGRLWILGLRTERGGTLVETVAGGITEVNGCLVHSTHGWPAGEPVFSVVDATLNLFGVSERSFNRQPVPLWVRERHGGETRELAELPWVFLGKVPSAP